MSSFDPERLVAAAQSGDSRALEELLAVHRETVFRYGLRFCRTTEDTEDAVQETLWAASRSIRAFRRGAAITTWLFTIVRNNCHRLHWQHRHDEVDLADLFPRFTDRTAEDELASAEIRHALAAAMTRLEPAHREILILRDVEGLTAPEAASQLGISVDAVKSRLHRAREALRGEVSAHECASVP